MKPVTIYSTQVCGYCMRAKTLLQSKQIAYTEYLVDLDADRRMEMENKSQRRSVPQIFIGEQYVGGYRELRDLDTAGKLDVLLAD